MVQMISKKQHTYAGRVLSEGDPFECEAQHVAFMIADSRAELDKQVQTRELEAEQPGAYLTRDMQAKRKTRRASH